ASANSRYCGTARITAGTSTPARITLKKSFLPRKSKMASPYPAAAETRVDTSAPPTAYSAVFPAQRRNRPAREAERARRFSSRYVEGAKVQVEKSSSALV